jgi:Tfp pilus assembly protein FimT
MAYRKPENPRTAACKAPLRAAFTLTELLVVVSVLITLFGLGVGAFLKLKGPYAFKAQVALVRTTIRKARNYALTQGTGAKVVVDPYANEVRACGVLTSGHWSFEDDSNTALVTQGAYGHDGILNGTSQVEGRFGKAYDFPPQGGAYIECEDRGAGIWDDVTGIQFICWIKPVNLKAVLADPDDDDSSSSPIVPVPDSDMASFVILEKGHVYSLALVEDYSIEIIVGDAAVSGRIRSRPGVVFPNRWNKIEVTFDGRVENPLYRIQISTNGIECFELYTFDQNTNEKVIFRSQEGHTFIDDDDILELLIPKRVPRTMDPLTISSASPEYAFAGAIDAATLSPRSAKRG